MFAQKIVDELKGLLTVGKLDTFDYMSNGSNVEAIYTEFKCGDNSNSAVEEFAQYFAIFFKTVKKL
jgi:hypothetical protein